MMFGFFAAAPILGMGRMAKVCSPNVHHPLFPPVCTNWLVQAHFILSRKIKFADGLWPWCRCLWRFDAGNWIRPGSELLLIFLEIIPIFVSSCGAPHSAELQAPTSSRSWTLAWDRFDGFPHVHAHLNSLFHFRLYFPFQRRFIRQFGVHCSIWLASMLQQNLYLLWWWWRYVVAVIIMSCFLCHVHLHKCECS